MRGDRPGHEARLKLLRVGDTLIVRKLDRLGRSPRHFVNSIHDLMERRIGLRAQRLGNAIATTAASSGRRVCAIFPALAAMDEASRGLARRYRGGTLATQGLRAHRER
jgi:DNA invertase Pin-like site-specific DNA recombinase